MKLIFCAGIKTNCLLLSALICLSAIESYGFSGKTYFGTRSQGADAARELVGWQELINQDYADKLYGALSFTTAYNRSFSPDELSCFILGSNCLSFSGSRYSFGRDPNDLLADYFGLPTNYKSVVSFSPRINNFVFDIDWYLGLNNLLPGLYFRIDFPITHSSWDLGFNEFISSTTNVLSFYPAGYMSTNQINSNEQGSSFLDYFCNNLTFGDMTEPLKYGMICERESENKLAEIRAALGFNWTGVSYHAGFNLRASAPTGTRPDARFFFEPIVGNGKHWEIGAGFTGHYDFWVEENCNQSLSCYLDANLMHLFSANQRRSFDFNGKPGSRYMLLEEVAAPSHGLFLGGSGDPASPYQYTGFILPAINATTLKVEVAIPFQADVVAKFSYHRKGLEVDLGYNFWYISAESLNCRQPFASNIYLFKGDSQLYGFDLTASTMVALAPSQSGATIHGGQGAGNTNFANNNIDNPIVAADGNGPLVQLNAANAATLSIAQVDVNTSSSLVLLTDADIDNCSALMPKGLSNKIFFHVNNTWFNENRWQPFIGFGGEVEFARTSRRNNSAFNQYGIWAKGGIGF